MDSKTVCVIGLGYIGLPSAAILASHGMTVIGCDVMRHVVDTINAGKVHLFEPGLEKLVQQAVLEKKLTAQLSIPEADVFIVAVPTPVSEKNKPDISYVKSAIESIAPRLRKKNLVIIESTSPVGTTAQAAKWIQALRADLAVSDDIYLAYCPERVMPGQIIRELIHNDRVVGGINAQSTQAALSFYRIFVKGNCISTNAKTAEMTKLTENAFRDVNIAFANELSMICDQQDINVWELISLANRHPRVKILQPGPGVGGHCIAVDPWFIVASNPRDAKLIRAAREINDYKAHYVLRHILKIVKNKQHPVIACLGIAFKKDVDDLRESPALMIVSQLAEKTAGKICVVEPHIQQLPTRLSAHKNVELMGLYNALKIADIVVILVAHSDFKKEILQQIDSEKIIDVVGLLGRINETSLAVA